MKSLIPFVLMLAGCTAGQTTDTGTPAASEDSCNAAAYADLIGRGAASALAVPNPKRTYRIGDPITMDFNPNRVNIQLDETDTIFAVTCG